MEKTEEKIVFEDCPLPTPWKHDFSNFTRESFPELKEEGTLQEKLKAFKEHQSIEGLIKKEHHDLYLIRWLVARQWDVDKAVQMFVESMKWRSRNRVDSILEEFPKTPYYEQLRAYWPDSVSDDKPNKPKQLITKDGQIFYIERLAFVDEKILDYFPHDVLYRHHLWINEVLEGERERIFKETNLYGAITCIEDLEVARLGQLANQKFVSIIETTAKIDSDNYPESLRRVYLVNASTSFSIIWKVVGLFFDEETTKKFFFYGSGNLPTQELNSVIHSTCLPKHFGGTIDWDIGRGGKVSDYNLVFPDKDEAENTWSKFTVKSTYEIDLKLKENWIVHWEFMTKDYEIKYGLKYKENETTQKATEILPGESVESYKSPIYGEHKAAKDGIYILYWDNSHSYFHNKSLKYRIQVFNAEGVIQIQYPGKEVTKEKK